MTVEWEWNDVDGEGDRASLAVNVDNVDSIEGLAEADSDAGVQADVDGWLPDPTR